MNFVTIVTMFLNNKSLADKLRGFFAKKEVSLEENFSNLLDASDADFLTAIKGYSVLKLEKLHAYLMEEWDGRNLVRDRSIFKKMSYISKRINKKV